MHAATMVKNSSNTAWQRLGEDEADQRSSKGGTPSRSSRRSRAGGPTSSASSASASPARHSKRVAVIGAGVSGLAAAHVWRQCGYDVEIYDASPTIGGQWAKTYEGVTIQNIGIHYRFSGFDFPRPPARHPTAAFLLDYFDAFVDHAGLRDIIHLRHEVIKMVRLPGDDGWTLTVRDRSAGGGLQRVLSEAFCHVVLASGQYPGDAKYVPPFKGAAQFGGEIISTLDARGHNVFDSKRVVVVGFGKTALDWATWSAPRAQRTVQIFRAPRFTIPDSLLGVCYTRPFFARFGSDMMPAWVHPWWLQVLMHKTPFLIAGFWLFIATLFKFQATRDAELGSMPKSTIAHLFPPKSEFVMSLRSAAALAPPKYYYHVAHGGIDARRGEIECFTATGVRLASGEEVSADLVAVCCGNSSPTFAFLPDAERALLEGRRGGPQLYRHIVHPRIKGISFAGFNHGFAHMISVEIGVLWAVGVHEGDLVLPNEAAMEASCERVAVWKAANSYFEPTGNMAVNTRFQQYNDAIMQDLGLSMWRKMPNFVAEYFARYSPADYRDAVAEYLRAKDVRQMKGEVLHVNAAWDV